jgi:hypothetical protein
MAFSYNWWRFEMKQITKMIAITLFILSIAVCDSSTQLRDHRKSTSALQKSAGSYDKSKTDFSDTEQPGALTISIGIIITENSF